MGREGGGGGVPLLFWNLSPFQVFQVSILCLEDHAIGLLFFGALVHRSRNMEPLQYLPFFDGDGNLSSKYFFWLCGCKVTT